MKQVILIGDSIRMGYQDTVRQELAGAAEVWMPEANGGTTSNVLAHLDEWALDKQPAVVHINCGLHDLRKDFDATESAVPLAEYQANVRSIVKQIQDKTGATVIWATTTAVNEKWHHETKPFDRFEADVDAYNQAAIAVAEELDVPVDDLYSVVVEAGRDRILRPDGVHFNDEGSAILGKAVAAAIRPHLAEA